VSQWEYKKVDLSELPRGRDDIDVLCAVGEEGWELVAILANHVAYLKREIEDALFARPEPGNEQGARGEDAKPNGNASRVGASSEVKAKYRDPKTNETWSGRGRIANWLKKKQDAGEDIDDYLV
jgi:DNA-binding protein H-NS